MTIPMRKLVAATFAAMVVLVSACAVEPTDEEPADETADELRTSGYGATTLKYEGTCDFLGSCSKWSRGLPAGRVVWGCGQYNDDVDNDGADEHGACSNSELWVAGPTRSYCGKTVKICKGTKCVNAKVKDVSVSRDWEGSNGVFDALGLSYGLTGKCSGFGNGRVTVSASR